jgi:hypothetical protein
MRRTKSRKTFSSASRPEAGHLRRRLDNGTYRLATHNGVVDIVVTERSHATVAVRTSEGSFRSSLPIRFGALRLVVER